MNPALRLAHPHSTEIRISEFSVENLRHANFKNDRIKHVPEILKGGAALAGALKLTGVVKAMLGPATAEIAERIHDEVRLYRFGRQLECLKKAGKMASDAGFTPKAVPIKLLFPLLEGASLEENEDLHTMWASLLAEGQPTARTFN